MSACGGGFGLEDAATYVYTQRETARTHIHTCTLHTYTHVHYVHTHMYTHSHTHTHTHIHPQTLTPSFHDSTAEPEVQALSTQRNYQYGRLHPLLFRDFIEDFVQDVRRTPWTTASFFDIRTRLVFQVQEIFELNLIQWEQVLTHC